jgi:HD-like signal output (HDOD) protein
MTPQIKPIREIEGLPSFPDQLNKVLDMIGRTSAMDYNIVTMIQYDPAIASRVLKVANTPLYGYEGEITSLQQAAGLLGPGVIKNIILTTPILELSQNNHGGSHIDYYKLWLHMSVTGSIAGGLATIFGNLESDVCFTAGLIHDIGKIALIVSCPELVAEARKESAETKKPFLEIFKKIAGYSFIDIGVELAVSWGYPQKLIKVLRQFHFVDEVDKPDKLALVIYLAKYLANSWGHKDEIENFPNSIREDHLSQLGVTAKEIDKFKPELKEYADFVANMAGS